MANNLYISESPTEYDIVDNSFNFTIFTDCNQTRQCVDIKIIDDNFIERTETVYLVQSDSGSLIDRVNLRYSVIIINNTIVSTNSQCACFMAVVIVYSLSLGICSCN